VLLLLAFAYIRLFRIEWLAGSIDYDPAARLLLFQPTRLARLWTVFFGLIHLASLSRLLLNWILSSSPSLRQQAKWLLLSLFIPLLQLCSFFLPAQLRATTILYLRPWLLASMPLLIAWTLFRANLRPHYRSLVFQRMLAAGLVLDQQQRILALNPVAEQLFQVRLDQVEEQLLSQISFPFY
jgi:PAS domain-containing protein